MKLLRWVIDSYLRSLLIIGSCALVTAVSAVSWDVTNEPQMFLDVNITTTQTSGIVIASRQLNGEDYTYNTLSGGVLRVRWGSFREDIHFTSSTRNATTNTVTLSGVTRNICPHFTDQIISCGDGRNWGRGAIVERVQDARLFNLKVDIDRVNTGTSLFAIRSNQTTQPWLYPNCVTTAQRDAFTYTSQGAIICNSTTGTLQQYLAGAWSDIGTSSVVNMTTSAAGKAELATVADNSGSTVLGDSGAPVVIGTDLVIRNSTGAINARNKVVATWNNGYVFPTVLGSGLPGTSSGEYLLTGNNTWSSSGALGIVSQSILSGALKAVLAQDLVDTSGDVSITSTSFVPIDPLRLSGSVVTAAGDLIMFVGNLEYGNDASPCTNVTVDITIRDGTGEPASVSQNTVGRGIERLRCEASQERTSNFTFWHVAQTGGTLYPGLVVKVDGNDVTIRAEFSRFQIIRFPQ